MKPFNLDEYLKNPNKKVVTRDGKAVRIICTDFNNKSYPIIGEVQDCVDPRSFTEEGRCFGLSVDSNKDLFFYSEKKEGWINIFKGKGYHYAGDAFIYKSREDAEKLGKVFSDYIATAKIEWGE